MSDAQRPKSAEPNTAASGVEGQAVGAKSAAAAFDDVIEATNAEETDLDFATDVDGNPIPSPEVLAEQALPAIYTRAPRMVQVVATAAAVGAGVGLIIGALLPAGFASSRLAAAVVMGLACALLAGLIAGIVVAGSEEREARHVAHRKAVVIDEWLIDHSGESPSDSVEPAPKDSST